MTVEKAAINSAKALIAHAMVLAGEHRDLRARASDLIARSHGTLARSNRIPAFFVVDDHFLRLTGTEFSAGGIVPVSGTYAELNIFGTPTGRLADCPRGKHFPSTLQLHGWKLKSWW